MSENKDIPTEQKNRQFSKEVAQEQLDVFMNYYGLDASDYEPVDNAENQMQIVFNVLRRSIMKANLSIELDGGSLSVTQKLIYSIGEVSQIVYTDRIGQANRAMEAINEKKAESRKDAFMAGLSNTSSSLMIKLKGADRTLYEKISTVFSLV